jgi:hypothetical protein
VQDSNWILEFCTTTAKRAKRICGCEVGLFLKFWCPERKLFLQRVLGVLFCGLISDLESCTRRWKGLFLTTPCIAYETKLQSVNECCDLNFVQLLEMLDSGQAVDISGLPNKSLVSLLRSLFRSLNLMSTQRDIFLLPEGAQATVEIMSSFFEQNAGLFPIESNIQLPPTSALNDVVPGPSVKPVETKKSR